MLQTTLCYIEQDGKYLMLHRVKKKDDINHDKWIGIGGKFETGESPEDCLLREVREETGLTLTRWRYRGIVTFLSAAGAEAEYMHLFTATDFTGALKTCDEGDLEWIEKARLLELTLWEGDKIFLKLLDQDAPFFSLKLTYDGDRLTEAVLDGRRMATPMMSLSMGAAIRRPQAKEPVLISACLLGTACRYDGKRKPVAGLERLIERYQLIPICPEQLGGLPTPRTPSERVAGQVVTKDGWDVTEAYLRGAEEALRLARLFGCRKAILKERSPSCGSGTVYDGTFSGKLTAGDGVTAALLKEHGIQVFGESQVEERL